MKNLTLLKIALLGVILLIGSGGVWGQLLLTEPFNYTPHTTDGLAKQSAEVWKKFNSGDSILVETGNLSYSGLPTSTGNRVTFGGAGSEYYTSFTSQTTGTVYMSFLLNISNLGSLNTTGGYPIGFIDGGTTNFASRLWIRLSGTSNFNLGINTGSVSTNTAWTSNTLSTNTTYLVVVSYSFVTGTINDVSKIWINPVLGNSLEPTVDATSTNTTPATDNTSIQRVFFRQDGSSATPGTILIDEIRVGTTWASVTPASSIQQVATPTFSPTAGTYYSTQSVSISSTTTGASIYYTTDGTDPNNTGNGTLYSTAIPVSTTTTVKARAYATGYDPSAIASATYTILATQTTTIPYTENFTTGAGKTYAHSVSGDTKVWTYNAGGFMNINGYGGAALEEDWLVLPGINLNNYTGTKTLSFDTWWQYGTNDTDNYLKLMYSTDYAGVGDPSTATWTELTYTQPTLTNTWTSSGNIDLSSISGTSVFLAFKYRGTTGNYRSWSVDNISIQNPKYAVTFNADMNGAGSFTNVYVAGDFNSWSSTASQMTTSGGNIYTFTTDAVFNAGDVIQFKFVKDGTTWENDPNRTYTVVTETNTVNAYWNAATLPQLDWVNLQYPPTATIVSGNSLDVFAQVYEPGLTEAAGQGSDITAWVGYSTTDTNPITWTNWVLATFNKQSDNNDEYKATFGSVLAGGKYYYASRFKYGLNDYVYGGLNGLWDATNSKSGVLTVIATEPTAHVTNPAATPNSSTEITLSWTDATANGYLIKGSAVSFDDIAAPVDGVAETNGTLVRNVTSGTQTYKFTGLTAETTYYFKIFPYNGSGEQINYKVDGSVPQASAMTYKAPTVLQAGDIAILQVNTSTTDRIAFVTFVDLTPGTVVNFTDNGFTSATTVRSGEGFLIYTAPTLIPAGTVVKWYNGMTITGTGWNSASPSNFSLASGDQLFAYQGTWGTDQTLIYGVSLSQWITSGGSATTTFLPSALTDNVTAFCFATSKDNAYYTNITSGTGNALKSLITYNTNWTTSSTDQGARTWTFALSNSTSFSANASVNNLLVAAGESLTVNSDKQLTINGALINNGTFTVQTGATVITNGTVSGGGTTNVEQTLSADRNWWYLASPLSGASSSVFSGDQIGKYVEDYLNDNDGNTNAPYYTSPFSTPETLAVGRGYVIKRASTDAATYTFSGGSLNNGDVTLTPTRTGNAAAKRGFNLVGNPYPSYLNWELAYNANKNNNIRPTIWYRTQVSDGSGGYKMDFQTYNAALDVSVPTTTSGYIPPMQAFWLEVDKDPVSAETVSNGTLNLTNNMRAHASATGNSTDNRLKVPMINERQLVRLQVSNGAATDETVIAANPNASAAYDLYDSEKMSVAGKTEIFTLAGTEELVINGVNSLSEGNVFALGFRPGQTGSFSIEATQLENIDAKVMLLDKVAVTEQELTAGIPYTFSVEDAAATNDRFVIKLVSKVPTEIEVGNASRDLTVFTNRNNRIQVIYSGEISAQTAVSVYNIAGQKLNTQKITKAATELNENFRPGVYMVQLTDNEKKITQKLVIK